MREPQVQAYHTTRKATNDATLAAMAGMKAKEYLKTPGYEFKGTLRGSKQRVPKGTALVPEAVEAAPVAQPAAKKPMSIKQLQYEEKVKAAMAELRAQGAEVSIAAAGRLLSSKKAAELGA